MYCREVKGVKGESGFGERRSPHPRSISGHGKPTLDTIDDLEMTPRESFVDEVVASRLVQPPQVSASEPMILTFRTKAGTLAQ